MESCCCYFAEISKMFPEKPASEHQPMLHVLRISGGIYSSYMIERLSLKL